MLAASSSIFAAGAAMLASRATIKTLLRPDMLATLCIEFMHFTVALDASLFVETLLLLLIVDFLLYIYDSSRPCLEAPTSDTDTVVAIAEAMPCNSWVWSCGRSGYIRDLGKAEKNQLSRKMFKTHLQSRMKHLTKSKLQRLLSL